MPLRRFSDAVSNCNIIPNYLFYFHRDEYAFYFETASENLRKWSVPGEIDAESLKELLTPQLTWPKAKARPSIYLS
jgi:hypothetical protein